MIYPYLIVRRFVDGIYRQKNGTSDFEIFDTDSTLNLNASKILIFDKLKKWPTGTGSDKRNWARLKRYLAARYENNDRYQCRSIGIKATCKVVRIFPDLTGPKSRLKFGENGKADDVVRWSLLWTVVDLNEEEFHRIGCFYIWQNLRIFIHLGDIIMTEEVHFRYFHRIRIPFLFWSDLFTKYKMYQPWNESKHFPFSEFVPHLTVRLTDRGFLLALCIKWRHIIIIIGTCQNCGAKSKLKAHMQM